LYVATVTSRCFKSKSGVAHGMRVASGRHPGWHRTTTGVLAHKPDVVGRSLARYVGTV
jgi:hypothetical protein